MASARSHHDTETDRVETPTPFGKYYLLERLDAEGRTEVYRAREGGRPGPALVVVKRILPAMAANRAAMEQFAAEVEVAARLVHPGIARIIDLGWVGGCYYVTLEHVFGRDLRCVGERLRERGQHMPATQVAYLMMKVSEALAHAHEQRDAVGRVLDLVHRNVSPQSILVSFAGEIKLINFGMAKTLGRRAKTVSSIVKGTYGYMSPEQVRGLPIDRRSDLFSCGIVLYELLTGEHPFVGEDEFDMLEKVRNVELVPPSAHNRKIPAELERITVKALAKHADERYQRADELHDELQAHLFAAGALHARRELSAWLEGLFADELEADRARLARFRGLDLPVAAAVGDEGTGERLTERMDRAAALPDMGPDGEPDTLETEMPVPGAATLPRARGRWDEVETRLYDASRANAELLAAAGLVGDSDATAPGDLNGPSVPAGPPTVPPLGPPPSPPKAAAVPPPVPPGVGSGPARRPDGGAPEPARDGARSVPIHAAVGPSAETREYGAVLAERALAIAMERGTAAASTEKVMPAHRAGAPRGAGARRIVYIVAAAIGTLLLVIGGVLASQMLVAGDGSRAPGAAEAPIDLVGSEVVPGVEPGAADESGSRLPAEVLEATGFDLFIEPADATVKLDGKLLDMPPPMRIREITPGEHELAISAPSGFYSKTKTITVTAGQAEVIRIQLDPIEVRGRFTSEPPGAAVSLVADGEDAEPVALGETPVVHVLDARERYQAVFEMEGFEPARVDVSPGQIPEVPVHVALTPADEAGTATETAARASARRPPRRRAQAKAQRPRQAGDRAGAGDAKRAPGVLMLGSKPPCRIFIDGKDTGKTTPQRSLSLPAGRRKIKLVNQEFGIEETFTVTIEPGETTRVLKDMSSRIP